ncbi:imidazole glycerol phosphate synthase subunit HisF [Patescibacteria group bacterium]|nr:imidazole glycerol phosphate synthase subunit HisF [Patescibacteria group bacterium]
MQVIPAIDVLDGRIVRLKQGDFARTTDYGDDSVSLATKYASQGAAMLHVVNLTGTKDGALQQDFVELVRRITYQTNLALQVGGGIRSIADIYALFEAGVNRVVLGTIIFSDPELVRRALLLFGPSRIIAALDSRDGEVCIKGWQECSGTKLDDAIARIQELGFSEVLITDIKRDGMERGANTNLYAQIRRKYPSLSITGSGGVRDIGDIRSLRDAGCSAVVVGKALLNGQVQLPQLIRASQSDLAIRIIPCLDVAGGRTVKGTKFQNLRDAGDPVELARRYCEEGADELVFLDISATREERDTMFDLAAKVAEAVNIPFTIGGGVRSVEDALKLLDAGADKVAVNSAAVLRPALLSEMAEQFGRANTVCAIDARRKGKKWVVLVKGGTEETRMDVIKWAQEAQKLGAGEILLTSFDRDGTKEGFDTELLSSVKECVTVPVIASGGAGSLQSFVEAVEKGKADAVLAASVFHYKTLQIRDVKKAFKSASYPVRL